MKYPNPFASHVLASDVLERRLISTPGIEFGTSFSGLRSLISPNFQAPSPADSLENRKDFSVIRSFDRNNGVDFSEKLYSTRVFLKTGILPRWIRNLLPQLGLPAPSQAYIVEHSLLDPENKTLHTITRNLSHKKLLYVEEEQIFKQHPENPKWTLVEVNVRVESSIGGGWLRPKIEAMGVKRFDDQSKRVSFLVFFSYEVNFLSLEKVSNGSWKGSMIREGSLIH